MACAPRSGHSVLVFVVVVVVVIVSSFRDGGSSGGSSSSSSVEVVVVEVVVVGVEEGGISGDRIQNWGGCGGYIGKGLSIWVCYCRQHAEESIAERKKQIVESIYKVSGFAEQ